MIVVGRLGQRHYEKDGERKSSYEVRGEDVAPSLLRATAQVAKNGQQQPHQGYADEPPF